MQLLLPMTLAEKFESQVRVRFCPSQLEVSMVHMPRHTFVESYHRGGDEALRKALSEEGLPDITCFGGFAPVLMLQNSARFAQILLSHFENNWNSPEVVARELGGTEFFRTIQTSEENSG